MAIRGPYRKKPTTYIHKRRIELGLTQPEAAKRCGVGLRTYQRAEAGDSFDLRRGTKNKIERQLGAPW